jgi:NAD(P) transhydrogenase subunit alpha
MLMLHMLKGGAEAIPDTGEVLSPLVIGIIVFVLAAFVGIEVISKVPSTLHTPLMSGSNAISGITIVGALLALRTMTAGTLSTVLAVAAVTTAMINVVGGFLVTDRMLQMFRRPAKTKSEGAGS